MRSIVQTSNAVQANKWLAGARLIYDAVKSKRAALGLSTKPFSSWAGLDLDVQQIVAGQKSLKFCDLFSRQVIFPVLLFGSGYC